MDTEVIRIYCVTNATNAKRYVGQTNTTVARRWYKHTYLALVKNSNTRFYEAIRKYGKAAFDGGVLLQECFSRIEADAAESRWIKTLNTTEHSLGYNMTSGGNTSGVTKLSPDARAKISASKLGKPLVARTRKTDEAHRPIVDAFKTGKSRREIADEFDLPIPRVVKILLRWKLLHEPDLQIGPEHQYTQNGDSLKKRADEANQKIINVLMAGLTRHEAAEKFDISYGRIKQVITRHRKRCKEQGIEVDMILHDKNKIAAANTDERDAPIVALFEQGMKRRAIATNLGITYGAVKQALVRHRRRTWSVPDVERELR